MAVRFGIISVLIFLMLFSFPSHGQDEIPARPSPLTIVSTRYKDTYLKITYSQPHKRGREIFGKLVPFGQVWRTGANEATEMTFTQPVKMNGTDLEAGTYVLFTIPEKNQWTIIINRDLGLWGSYNYNPKMDLLRFEVETEMVKDVIFEAFTIQVDQHNDKAEIVLVWDRTKVKFGIQFSEPKQ